MINTKIIAEHRDEYVQVIDLKKYYPITGGLLNRIQGYVQAVDGVSFCILEGETFGLVGESGCGKTTIGRTLMRLVDASDGMVMIKGNNIMELEGNALKGVRREMQMVFQDPYASLNPRMTVVESVMEGLNIHNVGTKSERYDVALDMLKKVGLEHYHAKRYPHEFSGGQRQRIGIARALALRPKLIICDEPVSALDISIQSQVLNLLSDLQEEFDLTYLFIAHNLSVVQHISNTIGVMYLGRIVELANSDDIFNHPLHPYTQALMSAIPIPKPGIKKQRIILKGDVPSPINPPSGCRFHPRCFKAMDICSQQEPLFSDYGGDHWAACWALE